MMSGWEIIEEIGLVNLILAWIPIQKNFGCLIGKIWEPRILPRLSITYFLKLDSVKYLILGIQKVQLK